MNLREAREKAKLSQDEAGKKLGVSGVTVHYWESGKAMPRMTKIPRIAAVYDLSISETVLCCQESAKRE